MSTTAAAGVAPRAMKRFYIVLSAFIVLLVFVGFWPTYFGPLFAGTVDKVPFIHVHAAVYVGWLGLFSAQIMLAATGRTRQHIALGRIGIGYGVVVLIVGVAVSFVMFAIRVRSGEFAQRQGALLGPLTDMVVFAAFFGGAVYFRRRPELHKRLMIVATTSLLIAAVSRMPASGLPPTREAILLTWMSPLLLAMGYDLLKQRIVHPIYPIGIVVLVGELIWRRGAAGSNTWLDIEDWLATFFM